MSKEELADYVRRIREEKGLSLQDVATRSGNRISRGYISQIENRYIVSVTSAKLQALAKGLGIPEDELFAVARGVEPVTESDLADDKEIAALFYEYKDLTEEDKEELRTVFDMVRQEIRRRRAAGELASQKNSKKARLR